MKTKTLGTRSSHLLLFAPGDEFMATLIEFAQRQSIEGATFTGIGGFRRSTVGWFNREKKDYEPVEVNEQAEVLSITGSVARAGSEVKIHAHVALARRYGHTIGGHLLRAEVNPLVELVLLDHGTRLERRLDDATGLWMLDVK